MNYCPNCGVKLEPNAHFCYNCGVKTTAENPSGGYGAVNGQKSKFIAGILAIIVGALGIHNFYLGYTGKGIAQLLMWVFFLGWVSFIWGVIDAIRIFTGGISCDAKGVPLSDNI